ncbi:MAG: hypothetical protein JW751_22425 [Polyangiaceae bacterium]|nr:hypothetical protein [Polyangiaceae bacterium]
MAISVGLQLGCNSSSRRAARLAHQEGVTPAAVAHEDCPLDRAEEKLDADGDGRPEISTVKRTGKPVCQAVDLNRDGVPDIFTYFDDRGRVRRREYAYSRDAAVTEVRIYVNGYLTEIRQATTVGGQIDTWHYLKGGKIARSERDGNGDGRIDEWWEYPNAKKPDCPMMYGDANGDGKRDAQSGVDLCESGYVPPARDEFRHKSPDFQRPDSLPTEVENAKGEEGSDGK